MAKRSRLKMGFYALIGLLAVAAITFFMGPRVSKDTTLTFDASMLGDDLDTWLAEREAAVGDVRDGLEKQIVWAYPNAKAKTPYAIVYVHGFSASPGEIRPVPDAVAAELRANLFFTRLAGHGRPGAAMGETSVNDWVNDIAEAIAIGERLGEKIILMSTSTGVPLSTWAAAHPELSRNVVAMVNVSANYALQAGGTGLMTMPWGEQVVNLVLGSERSFEPRSEDHAKHWTSTYPTRSILPMGAIMEIANEQPLEKIQIPALFVYSQHDSIIRPDKILEVSERWGGPVELHDVGQTEDPFNHVVAGDVMNPKLNAPTTEKMVSWLNSVLP